MDYFAQTKGVRISTRKVRLIADAIRNISVVEAQHLLSVLQKRPSKVLEKTLKSAVANAVHNGKLKEENLMIKSIDISEGSALKRYHPSTRGRVHPYKKRSSHIRIVLEEKQ